MKPNYFGTEWSALEWIAATMCVAAPVTLLVACVIFTVMSFS